MNHKHEDNLRHQVLETIATGKAKMHSKMYFILRTVLYAFEIVFVAFLLIYLTSFIFFLLHQTGIWFVPSFGLQGVQIFLTSLPWIFIFIIFLVIIFLEILLKRYTVMYKGPILYSALVILLVSFFGGILVANTSLHRGILHQAQGGKSFPLVGPLYKDLCGKKFAQVHPGMIVDLMENVVCIQNKEGEVVAVFLKPNTRFPLGKQLRTGDTVVILGEKKNNHIQALGIRPIHNPNLAMNGVVVSDAKEKCALLAKEQ